MVMSIAANAQFKCVPGGLEAEDGKTFIVVPIEGTQQELYNKAKTAITSIFVSAKDVISYNEPDIIVVNGESYDESLFFKVMGMKQHFGMNYRIQLQFKDGKIRIDVPSVSLLSAPGQKNGGYSLDAGGGGSISSPCCFYKKDGKERYKGGIEAVQSYLNNLVNRITEKMQGGADEDW